MLQKVRSKTCGFAQENDRFRKKSGLNGHSGHSGLTISKDVVWSSRDPPSPEGGLRRDKCVVKKAESRRRRAANADGPK
jgi:hypothetical protein